MIRFVSALSLCCLIFAMSAMTAEAFQMPPNAVSAVLSRPSSKAVEEFSSPAFSHSQLSAYKRNKKNSTKGKTEEEPEKKPNLVLAYLTPWRNPNSIFVYLFLIVYILGSMSEAKSAAGM
jgi:hypothetical protein